ncbi:hypothetical protein [Saccharomonospora sp. CUA-673]|uniref:hypothetical protein n=1 Tax=Saccharomonospora sp. CUA-673 TaxID=1904969 RepID=UPI00210118AB|nr:hypothetical protein [Saccharomonospora sp. CUA-673]
MGANETTGDSGVAGVGRIGGGDQAGVRRGNLARVLGEIRQPGTHSRARSRHGRD